MLFRITTLHLQSNIKGKAMAFEWTYNSHEKYQPRKGQGMKIYYET